MNNPILVKAITIIKTKSIFLFVSLSVLFWSAAIIYSFLLGDSLRYPDEKVYYHEYGQNIANSDIFSSDGKNPTAFHPPLYPLLIGILLKIGFSIFGIRLINFTALFLTILLTYLLLRKMRAEFSPIISVFLILGYPVLFYTAGTLYPQTIGGLFLVIAVFFFWDNELTIKNIILTGLFLGLSILTIPTFLFVLPFFILFMLFKQKIHFLKLILLAASTFLIIAPWTIRNYFVFDQFVLVSSNFGINFLIGNSSATTPNNGPNAWTGVKDFIEVADLQHMDEFERNSYYTRSAIELIKNDPIHYGKLYFQKVANYFNYRNDLSTKNESSNSKDILMFITYGFMIIVILLRIIVPRKKQFSSFELFLILLYLASAFVSAIVFTRIRYRLPFDLLLIILASLSIEKFIQINFNKQTTLRS
ncbi:MAG: hypothetical protein CVU42_00560 [Chloroflexi bacterium HGW-Chloroflexi-4]|jgi:4-amino-4-deoxy-L-arabinose transferase-like glycosyltransferase|nr:MAG: hypothetical protein CVU42_00560 [Chloroflexi bacterium HGW-Chloroflexi-4]